MRRPYEKFIQMEIITLGGAAFFGFFALIKGYFLLAIVSVYFIVISIICDALIKWQFLHKLEASKQLLRAIILFLLAAILLIRT